MNIAQAAATAAKATSNSPAEKPKGTDFADVLAESVGGAVETFKEGERASIRALVGDANLTEVVAAVNNPEITLKTAMAVRNRVIRVYQEITRTPL